MRVASCGYTTHIATSHLVFLPVNLLHLRKPTQCPGLMIQCPGVITKCPGIMIMCPEIAPFRSIVMRACSRPLKTYPVLCGIILTSHLALVTVHQCPGITGQTDNKTNRKQCLPLPRKTGIAFTEEREERESGLREEKHFIMMRGGPLSAWELLPVPMFQTK